MKILGLQCNILLFLYDVVPSDTDRIKWYIHILIGSNRIVIYGRVSFANNADSVAHLV